MPKVNKTKALSSKAKASSQNEGSSKLAQKVLGSSSSGTHVLDRSREQQTSTSGLTARLAELQTSHRNDTYSSDTSSSLYNGSTKSTSHDAKSYSEERQDIMEELRRIKQEAEKERRWMLQQISRTMSARST